MPLGILLQDVQHDEDGFACGRHFKAGSLTGFLHFSDETAAFDVPFHTCRALCEENNGNRKYNPRFIST